MSGYAEHTPGPLERRELPWPGVVLIVNLGPPLEVDGIARRSFLAGPTDLPTLCRHEGFQAGMQVDLTPLSAHALLGGLPMHELAREVVGLETLLGRDPAEDLAALPTWPERFAALEALLAGIPGRPPSPDVAWAWRRLHESRGTVTVAQLCAELGCSRRHLARRFREQVGIPPKLAARIFRFQQALSLLETGRSIGDVALEAGFSDHAHLDRDFRDLAGLPPSRLLTERRGAPFPFVQDAVALPA